MSLYLLSDCMFYKFFVECPKSKHTVMDRVCWFMFAVVGIRTKSETLYEHTFQRLHSWGMDYWNCLAFCTEGYYDLQTLKYECKMTKYISSNTPLFISDSTSFAGLDLRAMQVQMNHHCYRYLNCGSRTWNYTPLIPKPAIGYDPEPILSISILQNCLPKIHLNVILL
jgi:hypothetical protein